MARARATQDDWRVYYQRAEQVRAAVGDPFRRHIERETLRERALIIGSAVLFIGLCAGFFLLTAP